MFVLYTLYVYYPKREYLGKIYKKPIVLKRMVEKAKILFDTIDLKIMELLLTYETGLKVYTIADKLKIKHKNLKPHIDKLISLDLVRLLQASEKGIMLASSSAWYKNVQDNYSKEDLKDLKEASEFEDTALRVLRKANLYHWKKKANKLLELDLRKARTQENGFKVLKPKEIGSKKSGNTNKNKGKRKK